MTSRERVMKAFNFHSPDRAYPGSIISGESLLKTGATRKDLVRMSIFAIIMELTFPSM